MRPISKSVSCVFASVLWTMLQPSGTRGRAISNQDGLNFVAIRQRATDLSALALQPQLQLYSVKSFWF